MKRYIAGILAVIVAAGAVAFTVPAKKIPNGTITFRYTLSSYTEPQVENNNNWTSGASLGGGSNNACQMEVTDTYTHLDANNNPVLNTSGSVIVIKAIPGAPGPGYVPDPTTSTGVPSAINKP